MHVAVVENVFYIKTFFIVWQLHKTDDKETCALITASTAKHYVRTCMYSLQHVYPSNHVAVVEQWLLGRRSGTPSNKEETRGYQRSNTSWGCLY